MMRAVGGGGCLGVGSGDGGMPVEAGVNVGVGRGGGCVGYGGWDVGGGGITQALDEVHGSKGVGEGVAVVVWAWSWSDACSGGRWRWM